MAADDHPVEGLTVFNPFPGLRAFEPDEDHLFFGREKEVDELLQRLRSTRFLSVVGTSGSGKSSLVRSGLIPSLHSGVMVTAGSSWRVAMFRPGEDPIGHLADALVQAGVARTDDSESATTSGQVVQATLRRGSLGIVDVVREARISTGDNLLIVVDQFEELFRFRRSRLIDNSRDEAISFVKLLLEATRQAPLPIYVVLTMRSDFIGDCIEYPGLPEAVNDGQYLVPRMTRDEVRLAITGPVAVGGGEIAPPLVRRLLNELGDTQDQLPVLQHALMRTWNHWERHHEPGEPIDDAAYEAIGTMREALSRHAEEAFGETPGDRGRQIAERMFKALTDTFSDLRGVRRPTSVGELTGICEATEAEVIGVVEIFRRPGRTFLMPPSGVPLDARSIIDLSHESLMRRWTRLVTWAEQDRQSASLYMRLSQAAGWFAEGSAGLWRNPELELGLRWRRDNQPTAAWGRRHDESFDRAMAFLDRSEQEYTREKAERAQERRRKLRQAQWTAAVFGALFIIAGWLAFEASRANRLATKNLGFARAAVDQTLSSAGLDPSSAGADAPQLTEFRRGLLEKAKGFYVEFLKQDARSENLRNEMAQAHLRLGHIERWLEDADAASQEYGQAIGILNSLKSEFPKAEYRQSLGNAYNWLGWTLTPLTSRAADAQKAYDSALSLQEALVETDRQRADYTQELARTRDNRGILHARTAEVGSAEFKGAELDFREAIRLLEPFAARDRSNLIAALELSRASNNLAILLAQDEARLVDARRLYENAVRLEEDLTRADPTNREYKLELARSCNNLSDVLRQLGADEAALASSQQALVLLDALALPAPSLGIEQADAHTLRGQLLKTRDRRAALREYQKALELFEKLWQGRTGQQLEFFHQRYQDLLLNLTILGEDESDEALHELLVRAVLGYLALGQTSVAAGAVGDAQVVLDIVSKHWPDLSERDRSRAIKPYKTLQDSLSGRK